MASNFYTIPADFDFLDALAKRLMTETADTPLSLKDYTIILPDYTACRMLAEKLESLNDGKPMIMPQVVTPDGMDDDVLMLRMAGNGDFAEKALALPPAVKAMQRELYLTREILKHPETADSVATAVRLARELAGFIDELHTANVPLEKLSTIKADDFPGDLEKTRNVLKIVTDVWPQIKKDLGVVDREERREAVLNLLSDYFAGQTVDNPVIMAGFTRFSDGMTRLSKTFAGKSDEAVRVVLPGVDMNIESSWKALGPSHPQYTFKKLLADIGVNRDDVTYWPGTTASTHSMGAKERAKFLREAMRPSATTHKWKNLKVFEKNKLRPSTKIVPKGSPLAKGKEAGIHDIDPVCLTGLDMIIAGTPQEEASTIALKFREMLEKPGLRGTLITPDRDLAQRVAARLKYWDIDVSPDEGRSLAHTKLGEWLIQTTEMAVYNLAPVALLDCLKNPYASLGRAHAENVDMVDALEDMALRGPRPWPGFEGLKKSLSSSFNEASAKIKLSDRKKEHRKSYEEVKSWLEEFQEKVAPHVETLTSEKPLPFKTLLTAHINMIESMAATDETPGAEVLWTDKTGGATQKFLRNMLFSADILPDMAGEDYLEMMKMQLRAVRVKTDAHPRIRIALPDRAHLYRSDMNVVAGLTAANWPGKKTERFWLSPGLRKRLGLAPLECEIGNAAYDFTQAIANKNSVMTRSERNQTAPVVSSPFLTRIEMLLTGLGLEDKLKPKTQVLAINEALHKPAKITPMKAPMPTPPQKARPRRLSVSAIEQLLRDPYAVYARHVLKLYPKEQVDADPSYAERGNIIHDALDQFKTKHGDRLPDNAYDKLLDCGREAFSKRMDNPAVRAFWWPRFERMAAWFVEYEQAREGLAKTLKTEVPGKLELDTDHGQFILTAIADRIDELMDDTLSVVDYKTGSVPSKKDVENGLSPQLTLEALIAMSGGFKGVDGKTVGMMEYWKFSGARPAGKVTRFDDIENLQVEALEGLTRLINHFLDPKSPYLPTPRPRVAPPFQRYGHLSRSEEWGRDVSHGKGGGRGRPGSATGKSNVKSRKGGGPKS